MVRSGDEAISSAGIGEEGGWAEVVEGECAGSTANRAMFIKTEFNSPDEAFFTVLY